MAAQVEDLSRQLTDMNLEMEEKEAVASAAAAEASAVAAAREALQSRVVSLEADQQARLQHDKVAESARSELLARLSESAQQLAAARHEVKVFTAKLAAAEARAAEAEADAAGEVRRATETWAAERAALESQQRELQQRVRLLLTPPPKHTRLPARLGCRCPAQPLCMCRGR